MPSKRDILDQLKRDELLAAVAQYQLEVTDRRSREPLVDALAASPRADLAAILGTLARERLKETYPDSGCMAHIPYAAYQRPQLRLAPHDYSGGAVYFITVSTFDRRPLFGEVDAPDRVRLSALGLAVEEIWRSLPKRYAHVEIDARIVMPEHFHALIALERATSEHDKRKPLGSVIGAFKSMVTNAAKDIEPSLGNQIWQSNFYDRIVRTDRELEQIRRYILENPARRWARMNPG